VSRRVRRRAVKGGKVLHVARIAGVSSGRGEAAEGQGDVRREYVEDDEEDLARDADDPRSQRGPSGTARAATPEVAGDEPLG
jgi:hypothetical protein